MFSSSRGFASLDVMCVFARAGVFVFSFLDVLVPPSFFPFLPFMYLSLHCWPDCYVVILCFASVSTVTADGDDFITTTATNGFAASTKLVPMPGKIV